MTAACLPRTCLAIMASAMLLCSSSVHAMSCSMTSTPQLSFGHYDPLSPIPLDIQGSLSIHCTPAFPGESLNLGISFVDLAENFIARNLQSGDTLRFNLYKDPARALPLGDETLQLASVLAGATTLTIPLYGRVPARQSVAVGQYQSLVTVKMNY